MNNLYKHIFRSNRLQIFFKISALKNSAILRIKKRLQRRCFPVRSSHMVLTYSQIFSQNTYHQLLLSCEYCKVFKNSFFIEHLHKSSRLQIFLKTGILKSFANFTAKHSCWSLFLKNLQAEVLQLHRKRFQRRCFPVKFPKFV